MTESDSAACRAGGGAGGRRRWRAAVAPAADKAGHGGADEVLGGRVGMLRTAGDGDGSRYGRAGGGDGGAHGLDR